MYTHIKVTIGEKMNIFAGRMILWIKASFSLSPVSSIEHRAVLPVSFRKRATLRAKRTGAYVSRNKKNAATVTTPDCLMSATHSLLVPQETWRTRTVRTQNTQRHPLDSHKNPPTTGKRVRTCFLGVV